MNWLPSPPTTIHKNSTRGRGGSLDMPKSLVWFALDHHISSQSPGSFEFHFQYCRCLRPQLNPRPGQLGIRRMTNFSGQRRGCARLKTSDACTALLLCGRWYGASPAFVKHQPGTKILLTPPLINDGCSPTCPRKKNNPSFSITFPMTVHWRIVHQIDACEYINVFGVDCGLLVSQFLHFLS